MPIGVRVGSIISEIGASSFFNSFFSTIKGLLEPAGAGTRFPVISDHFYDGCIPANKVNGAIAELGVIKAELSKFPPSAVIWDIDDRSQEPPWGSDISSDITSMGNYFVTSTGRDLLDTLFEMFEYAKKKGFDVTIEDV
jgi:hypothetical protein